jgi:hypothetical protein
MPSAGGYIINAHAMHDALPHHLIKPLFDELTVEEIVHITGMKLVSIRQCRIAKRLPVGKKYSFLVKASSGRAQRIQKTYTSEAAVRAWLIKSNRLNCLPVLDALLADKLIEAKAASSIDGE